MLKRILFLAVVSLQLSSCIATPHFGSRIADDYEPPKEKKQVAEQQQQPTGGRQLSDEAKAEIRKQVREELRLQQQGGVAAAEPVAPKPTPKYSPPVYSAPVRPSPAPAPTSSAPSVVSPDSAI